MNITMTSNVFVVFVCVCGFFPSLQEFGWFIPHLCVFFVFYAYNGDQLAHINSTLYARISPQWLSELRQLWPSVAWQVLFDQPFITYQLQCLY